MTASPAAGVSAETPRRTAGALTPPKVSAPAATWKKFGAGFARRFLMLAILGLIWIAPAFRDRRFLLGMLAWDVLLLFGWAMDLANLPRPGLLALSRLFKEPLALSVESQVEIVVENQSRSSLEVDVIDELPVTLRTSPAQLKLHSSHGESAMQYALRPSRRGDADCGYVFLKYQSSLGLAERWARADLRQTVRVYPNLKEAERHSIYLMRSRQIEMEKRFLKLRGEGREFESLRDYQEGDDLRDVCWSAAARRGKPITKIYQVERSQPVWIMVDCGRLMRTRVGTQESKSGFDSRNAETSKLDCAVNAALSLAEVAVFSGDRVGLLAYGRNIRALVPPGRGSAHLRHFIDQLAVVHEEVPEADHLRASGALLSRQRRRALVIWLTDLAETAMTPEVVQGALRLIPPHLVLFIAISQPDLRALAAAEPHSADQMFKITAAQELINRRERLLATLREHGVLALEADWRSLSTTIVNEYLNLKEQSRI